VRNLIVCTVLLAAAACRPSDPDTASVAAPVIGDAAHAGGRAGFYFLPPLVRATALPPEFDPTLALKGRLDDPSGTPLAFFAFDLQASQQRYTGKLDTRGLALDPDVDYRVRVFADVVELGFADVRIFVSQKQARSMASEDYLEIVEDGHLKIDVYVNRCAVVTCDAATACRAAATCDPTTGTCGPAAAQPDGTPCPDGDVCNGSEQCKGGSCFAGRPLSCDDGDACTADSCDADEGCRHVPIADGVARWDCAVWDQSTWAP
jgi:hypothetical protein